MTEITSQKPYPRNRRKVALVGAGNIAATHAEVLRAMPKLDLSAIVDPAIARAASLARTYGVRETYDSIESLIANSDVGTAHVLVPPPLHAAATRTLLGAGISVLCEKPLATTYAECLELLGATDASTVLGTNQNFVFDPTFLRLTKAIDQLGPIRHIACVFSMPLRQLESGQFGHWMFQSPLNLLLEQAVHPLSQIRSLVGPFGRIESTPGPIRHLDGQRQFVGHWSVSILGERAPAQLHVALGATFPVWTIVIQCSDGSVTADIIRERCDILDRTRYPDFADNVLVGLRRGAAGARDAGLSALGYAIGLTRIRGRLDPFYLSMRGAIDSFHQAVVSGKAPAVDGRFGSELVAACEKIASTVPSNDVSRRFTAPAVLHRDRYDVIVLGGNGFIGKKVVSALCAQGASVAVASRTPTDPLPYAQTQHFRLDISDSRALDQLFSLSETVINLAQGIEGNTNAAILQSSETSARALISSALERNVRRLVHVGTIASLYLGDAGETVTHESSVDARIQERGIYARAKALIDTELLKAHARQGLAVCILRPGIVVGEGATPLHSGLGFFNNNQHCLGWNHGRNALPFVLADDVANALIAAISAKGVEGLALNLVGDVRPSAREYLERLSSATGRPLKYHANRPEKLFAIEYAKWLVKRALRKPDAEPPSLRDLRSRGLTATFDCNFEKQLLGWHPVGDREGFFDRALSGLAARAS